MDNNKDSFFSMDRLVEFGMGMAMSQQIVQGMNNMMASMRQPPLTQNVYNSLPVQQTINPVQNQQPVYQQYNGFQRVAFQQTSQNPAAFAQVGNVAEQITPPPVPQENNGASENPDIPIFDVYYISRQKGNSEGPFSSTEIARLVVEKQVKAETLVWKAGLTEWKTAADFPDILALIALVPPELPNCD